MDAYAGSVGMLQTWIFETLVQPSLYATGLIGLDEIAFEATEWFILGALQVLLLFIVLRPLEAWRPAERWSDRQGVGVDIFYTLLHRLGLVPLLFFALVTPIADSIEGWTRLHGFMPWNVEGWWPALVEHPFTTFVIYLVVLDLAEYLRHRLQHRFELWWALHALHHSQQRMSFWTDDRNHLLDDLLQAVWLATLALLIGVSPSQFAGIVMLTRSLESLSHANVDLSFGRIGERLLVSPRFHRLHHAIGTGHEGVHHGCNFAILFPVWDILFGTARWQGPIEPTGVRDQGKGHDYGASFLAQQRLGLSRVAAVISGRSV